MTKDELKAAIIARGGSFDPRINKAGLEDIYAELYPENFEPADENAETIQQEPKEVQLDENGEPIKSEEAEEAGSFDELLGKIQTAEPPKDEKKKTKPLFEGSRQRTRRTKSSPDQMRIEGYILLLVIDTVYPATLSMLNNMLDKKLKVQAHQLSLKPEQWKSLEPLADQAADYLAINLNPIAGFVLISTFMYGNNLINVRMIANAERNAKV